MPLRDRLRIVPTCPSCRERIDAPDRFCRSCGCYLRVGSSLHHEFIRASPQPRKRTRGIREKAIATSLVAATLLVIAMPTIWPRPVAPEPATSRVLLDVEGKVVTDGKSMILIASTGDGERRYASYRLQWSASAPLRIEVGHIDEPCVLLNMGGRSSCANLEVAEPAGDRVVVPAEDSKNLWFVWGDETVDGEGTTVHRFIITAALA